MIESGTKSLGVCQNRGLTAPRAASRIESGLDAVTSGLSCDRAQ